jgi:hypothetical protein
LSLLQVLQPPFIPSWAADRFHAYPTLTDGEIFDKARDCFIGYQEMARLHGESVDLASLSCDWAKSSESRTRIQGILRGGESVGGQNIERLLLEAAVFIEMARELDQQEIELEAGYEMVHNLEEEFKQIVGISPEDELEEAVQGLQPLWPEKTGLIYMLRKRISNWLRLLACQIPERQHAFVSLRSEVVEELIDPVRAERNRTGKPLEILRRSLAVIPSLERLRTDDFRDLLSSLHAKDVLVPYWQSLDNFLIEPNEAKSRGELDQRVDFLRKAIEDFCRNTEYANEHDKVEFTLVVPQDCHHDSFWKCFDRSGYKALQKHMPRYSSPSALMCLE